MRKDKVVYSLCVQDIQNVVEEITGHTLSEKDLKDVIEELDRVGLEYFETIDTILTKLEIE